MRQIILECFKNERRVAAMNAAFARLQFCSLEVRTFGIIRLATILLSALITTSASLQSNSPIPLFLLLAVTVQSFVGSLFPRRGTTPSLANPSLLLPLLTIAALFHFGSLFLWGSYRGGLEERVVIWTIVVVIGLVLVQFAIATLRTNLRGKTMIDAIRWTYAVGSLVLFILSHTFRQAIKQSNEVPEILTPVLQYLDAFLWLDYLLVSGFFILVVVEGLYPESVSPLSRPATFI